MLARSLTRSESVSALELAQAWAQHVGGGTGQRHAGELEPAAAELLGWWREELARFEVFRTLPPPKRTPPTTPSYPAGRQPPTAS